MTLRSLLVGAFVVVFVSVVAGQQIRTADVMVPAGPIGITLELPSNPFTAQVVLQRVLDAAGVRYGLEGPAWDPATPPIDFARQKESSVQLSGRRLGDALDLIVKAAPQYRWTEIAGGVIVIRSVPAGQSILDRQVPQFSVTDASPRVALEAIVAALDPSRPRGLGILGAGRAPAGAAGTSAPAGRNVNVSLTNATLETVLSTVAQLNGALAWSIQYDRAPATLENASITLSEHGQSVMAQSRQTVSAVASPRRQSVPVLSSVAAMLSSYAVRHPNVKLSVEEVEGRDMLSFIAQPAPEGLPPLELPENPVLAIARIIALDSRYESAQIDGRHRVRPSEGVRGRIDVLDKTVNGFTATNEPAKSVIERSGRTIGIVRPMGVPARAESIQRAMATPLTIDLRGTVTVREILDAIADATGWSWSLRPQMTPGQPTTLDVQWRGVSPPPSSGNWSIGVTIALSEDLSPAARPVAPPTRLIPTALDREIHQVTMPQEPGPGPFRQLAVAERLPLMIEEAPPASTSAADPRRLTRGQPPLVVGPGKMSDAVYVLLEKLRDYEIVSTDGFVTIAPSALQASSDYFMTRPLRTFAVSNVGLFRAVGELRRMLDPQFTPVDWVGDHADILNRPVTLSVMSASPREILNRLARQHGDIIWSSSFQGPGASIQSWVITLTPMTVSGPVISIINTGVVPASSLLPRTTRALAGRMVRIDLPVTPVSLRVALGAAGRFSNGLPAGIEGVASVTPTLSTLNLGLMRPVDSYDLSGLSGQQLMDTLQELAPEYEFTIVNDLLRVKPRTPQTVSTAWLDQRVDRFEHRFENLREAIQTVAALRPLSPGRTGPQSASPGPSSLTERLQKTFVVSLTNTTVRDILDEIARQFGRIVWSAEQRTSAQGVTSISLWISGFEGWGFGETVR
jgi:hypothetical protein